jgi:hypothetical protein
MRLSAIALAVGFVILDSRGAVADCAADFSLGPQVAWSWGKTSGISWGWEAGAGCGPQRLNVGQIYRQDGALSYAVAEPYTLYIGLTLGIGYERKNGLVPIFGLWEGVPVVYPDNCAPDRRTDFGFLFTVAMGYRYGGGHQVYLTPKGGISQSATACDRGPVVSGG